MKLDPREPSDLVAILFAWAPLLWLVRWAFQQQPRNYVVVLGTVVILLVFSFGLFVEVLPTPTFNTLAIAILILAPGTLSFGAGVWSSNRKNWSLAFYLGMLEVVLVCLIGSFGQGTQTGWFLIVGWLAFLNTLVLAGVVVGQILLALRKAN